MAAARAARTQVSDTAVDGIRLPPAPPIADDAAFLTYLYVRYGLRNCLVQSLVRQEWHRGHGRPRELVIGVRAPGAAFQAHAWLDGDAPHTHEGFEELARFPSP
jgi:transglutaminase superfamily protein